MTRRYVAQYERVNDYDDFVDNDNNNNNINNNEYAMKSKRGMRPKTEKNIKYYAWHFFNTLILISKKMFCITLLFYFHINLIFN